MGMDVSMQAVKSISEALRKWKWVLAKIYYVLSKLLHFVDIIDKTVKGINSEIQKLQSTFCPSNIKIFEDLSNESTCE